MNPYEWPWENDPVGSSEPDRVTTRLRKKVRQLSQKVSRMDRELRKMRKYLQRMARASAPAPRPPVSELTLRLVGEAQRAAASYSATRSGKAAQEAARTRDALLRHVAELESPRPVSVSPGSAMPTPPATPPAGWGSREAEEPPPPAVAPVPPAQEPPPADAPPVPDSMYRWMRDAVSLLRAAGFASAGHGILRDQLTEQALSFMAQRAATAGADSPRTPSGPRMDTEQAPIGRPRLGGAPLSPPAPPSMSSRPPVRYPETFQGPAQDDTTLRFRTPPPPQAAAPRLRGTEAGPQEVPDPEDARGSVTETEVPPPESFRMDTPLSDHPPYDSSAEAPLTDPGEGAWPGAHQNGDMDGGEYGQGLGRDGEEDESGPRRWWSYAPIPPRAEE